MAGKHTPEPWVAHGAFYTHGAKGDVFAKDARDVYEATPICRVVAPVSHRKSKNGAPIDALHATARRMEHGPIIEANAARIVACVNACEGIPNPTAIGDVLEALRWIAEHCPVTCDMSLAHEMSEIAEAALAKLEGRSND